MRILATVTWLDSTFGGRKRPPVIGLKPEFQLQRLIIDSRSHGGSIEIVELSLDPLTQRGTITLLVANGTEPRFAGVRVEEQYVLLDGYRIIAVGIVKEIKK